jgi:hydrogenase expression/formation protein HypE
MSENSEKNQLSMQGLICPVPISKHQQVVLGHGSGGKLTQNLISQLFYAHFGNPVLLKGDDSAVVPPPEGGNLAISTDSHIVSPLFFPGGDIGSLAVCGTVNDLAMSGAKPLWMTASFILEEGLEMERLQDVVISMQRSAEEAGVLIVAGDTKVAEKGKADGLFITTTGVGWVPTHRDLSGANAQPGDQVLLSGPIGDHGIAVLAARGDLDFEIEVESDIAPLNGLVEAMFAVTDKIRVLRDPTRGGVATALNEIACQSETAIMLDEDSIPVRPAVAAVCEMLGFDPLYVANEGKLLASVPTEHAGIVLQAMQDHPFGRDACRIGEVVDSPAGRVLMKTAIGGTRIVDVLSGEMLPRIC